MPYAPPRACPTSGPPAPIGAARWDALIAEARRQEAPFADRLAALRSELLDLEVLLTPMDPVQTCHLDLWFDNLRATPGGELCVLDWDNCGPGDPSRELAMVLFDFARTSPERGAALYAAYRDAGGPGRVRTPTDFSLLIAQLGHIGAMQLRRWLDPATSDRRPGLRPRAASRSSWTTHWSGPPSTRSWPSSPDLAQQVVPAGQQYLDGRRGGPGPGHGLA